MRAIRASGSVLLAHSSFDSVLPLRCRSRRIRSSAVGVSMPLSWAIRNDAAGPASDLRLALWKGAPVELQLHMPTVILDARRDPVERLPRGNAASYTPSI